MKSFTVDDKTICDLECILNGQFSPLTTFMNFEDWQNVCSNFHLANGDF